MDFCRTEPESPCSGWAALLVWALYACTQMAIGQNYTVSATPPPTDIDAQISYALSDIDLSPVTSGILKDKSPKSTRCFSVESTRVHDTWSTK